MIHEFTVYIETPDDYVPPTSEVLQDVLHQHFGDVHSRMGFAVEETGPHSEPVLRYIVDRCPECGEMIGRPRRVNLSDPPETFETVCSTEPQDDREGCGQLVDAEVTRIGGGEIRTDGGSEATDREDWPTVDVQAAPDEHREAVKTCLTDHLDDDDIDVTVTSMGKDPRSILATCERCETVWWFETIPEEGIPGTEAYEQGPLGGDA